MKKHHDSKWNESYLILRTSTERRHINITPRLKAHFWDKIPWLIARLIQKPVLKLPFLELIRAEISFSERFYFQAFLEQVKDFLRETPFLRSFPPRNTLRQGDNTFTYKLWAKCLTRLNPPSPPLWNIAEKKFEEDKNGGDYKKKELFSCSTTKRSQ